MKRRIRKILGMLGMALVLSILWTTGVWALAPSEGTVTSWSDKPIGSGTIRLFQVSYVSSSAGGGLFTCSTSKELTGWILEVETDPGATTPDDNYDITLLNANGRDVMGGALANRDQSTTEVTKPTVNGSSREAIVDGLLVITVTAMGNAKTAEILIYYLP